jgi:dipeptide transport system ATP-binding protein
LLSATPTVDAALRRQRIILQGELPSPINPPTGCAFHTRCPIAFAACKTETPRLQAAGAQTVACLAVQRLAARSTGQA